MNENMRQYLTEAQKVNPNSKKFLKGMNKIKVKGLGGWMPGQDYVWHDEKSKKFWFVHTDGDHMELKNTGTLKQLRKLHGSSINENVKNYLTEEYGKSDKQSWMKVLKDINKIRDKHEPDTDEAIVLGIFRDIVSSISRKADTKRLIEELKKTINDLKTGNMKGEE